MQRHSLCDETLQTLMEMNAYTAERILIYRKLSYRKRNHRYKVILREHRSLHIVYLLLIGAGTGKIKLMQA
jgi:hypothetical protein